MPVNQNTIVKVYDLLAAEGVISRRQGDGTYVADAPPALKKSERSRQVSALLGQAAAQAVHFAISPDELHALLDKEIQALAKGEHSHV